MDGDITDWDFSGTCLVTLSLNNYNYNNSVITGDTSGWSFPDSFRTFYAYGWKVSCLPEDYSNTCLNSYQLYQVCGAQNDINDIDFGDCVANVNINYTSLCGNLENYTFPSGLTQVVYSRSCFTGSLSGMTMPTGATNIQLCYNDFTGDIQDFNYPSTVSTLDLSYNPSVTFDLSQSYDTGNLINFYICGLSAITGSFSNLNAGNNLCRFYAANSNISATISGFDLNNLACINLQGSSISEDITEFLSGATGLCSFCFANNPNLSGDTSGLDFSSLCVMVGYSNSLSGDMCHFNPYCIRMSSNNLSSDIGNDFDFSNRAYYIMFDNNDLVGHLSGVSFNFSNIYYFWVNGNANVCGSNEFTNYIFVNRKNFTRPTLYLYYSSIGDTVSGTSEVLGDLGTYAGDPSGMDLTEAEVNNLVAGIDYDGGGTNTPWDNKNKIWWMKNACVSSSSTTKRYSTFNMSYSG
jgi:hypothetical protein